MLRIDRVKTDMELLPSSGAAAPTSPRADAAALLADAGARERIKELVLEALREHLRQLERQGVV
jgi:hypothetical protein